MHPASEGYVGRMIADHRLNRAGYTVVEIGSYNVNGSVRPLFDAVASYVGIDRREGPGVDVVADGATFGASDTYDVVVTTSALEHDGHPGAVVANALRILKPGGHLVITTVGAPWQPHNDDGGAFDPVRDTYSDITTDDLTGWLSAFDAATVETTADGDILAYGCKAVAS